MDSPQQSSRLKRRPVVRGLLLLLGVGLLLALAAGAAIAIQVFSPRPLDTTESRVFAADGSLLDECELPALDGTGLSAADIPKAFTPGCGWTTWPMPVLAECTEPLPEGVPDLRGMWRGTRGEVDHIERIEQCGNRVVVTSSGIIHDFVADGTLRNGAHDVRGAGDCSTIRAAIEFEDGVMKFRPFGLPLVLVSRRMGDDVLFWRYPRLGEMPLRRICRVPAEHRKSSAATH